MDLKKLFTEDRGVSPVIGVILMVAITVILAAVIGAFVLGLGDSVSDQPPNAQISFDFDGEESVTLTHDGGDAIQNGSVSVNINGSSTDDLDDWAGGDDRITAGDSVTIDEAPDDIGAEDLASGNTVRVVWTGGDTSSTIAQRTWP